MRTLTEYLNFRDYSPKKAKSNFPSEMDHLTLGKPYDQNISFFNISTRNDDGDRRPNIVCLSPTLGISL
jgi:hypothetical protein